MKGKTLPHAGAGRDISNEVMQLAAATMGFKGWKIKVYPNTELRLAINLTRLLCLHCKAIIIH
jgi:hypothetical protein